MPPLSFKNSRFSGVSPSVKILRLSLVCPQPVALSRLKTGTRISSRIDGSPTMRSSPVWPLEKKT